MKDSVLMALFAVRCQRRHHGGNFPLSPHTLPSGINRDLAAQSTQLEHATYQYVYDLGITPNTAFELLFLFSCDNGKAKISCDCGRRTEAAKYGGTHVGPGSRREPA
jgi:hypothetical protein